MALDRNMMVNEYQVQARTTAIYPKAAAVLYPALGLAGEAGELCNKIKKLVRDAENFPIQNEKIPDELRAKLVGEIGDTLWYLANLAADLGCNLGMIAEANIKKLASRQERGVLKGDGDNR